MFTLKYRSSSGRCKARQQWNLFLNSFHWFDQGKKTVCFNLWFPFPGCAFLFLFTEEPCLILESPAVLIPDVPLLWHTPPTHPFQNKTHSLRYTKDNKIIHRCKMASELACKSHAVFIWTTLDANYEGDFSWRTVPCIVWYQNTTMERVTGRDLTHTYCKPSWLLSPTKETDTMSLTFKSAVHR